jgi:site-specific DNA-methyltransferase (adenine-specific)
MELMARYPDKYFQLAIADPPYGIGESGNKNNTRGGRIRTGKKFNKNGSYIMSKTYSGFAGNDKEPPNVNYFKELQRVSVNQIIWGANHFIENIPNANSSCWIVWNKRNGNNDFADCELAWTSFNTAVRMFEYKWHGMLQEDMANKETRIHPTQKPVALYKWLLTKYAKEGDKILDTHLGSASIAIACHDLNFDLTGCELDKHYFDLAIKRVQDHTNQLKLF